jgi:hypothetical protein
MPTNSKERNTFYWHFKIFLYAQMPQKMPETLARNSHSDETYWNVKFLNKIEDDSFRSRHLQFLLEKLPTPTTFSTLHIIGCSGSDI